MFFASGISLLAGCDKLGMSQSGPVEDGAPDEQQLQKIAYLPGSNSDRWARMSRATFRSCP
jgi:hypothetical protein